MIKLKNCKINDDNKCLSNKISSPLKVANFNLNIQYPAYTCRRYSEQQKIMSRRQMVYSPFSKNQLFKRSNLLNIPRTQHVTQTEQSKIEFKCFNPQSQSFYPFIKEKITQIRAFIYKTSHNKKKNEQHHINFTELAILQQKPKTPAVLHSRIKKQCPLLRASQTRIVANNGKTTKRSETSCDNFNSIQIHSNVKYGSTVKLGLHDVQNQNKQLNKMKKKLQKQLLQRSYTQRKKTSRSAMGKSHRDRYENECEPWQIKKVDNGQQMFVFE